MSNLEFQNNNSIIKIFIFIFLTSLCLSSCENWKNRTKQEDIKIEDYQPLYTYVKRTMVNSILDIDTSSFSCIQKTLKIEWSFGDSKMRVDTVYTNSLLERMESCDEYYFKAHPLYYYTKMMHYIGNNELLAVKYGKKALELFELYQDTTGQILTSLHLITSIQLSPNFINNNNNNSTSLYSTHFLESRIKQLSTTSSKNYDKILGYYDEITRSTFKDPSELDFDYIIDIFNKAKFIIKSDTTNYFRDIWASDFYSSMSIIYQRKRDIPTAYKYAKEGYLLFPQDDGDYPTTFNYAILAGKANKIELATTLFQKSYEEYEITNLKILQHEISYHRQLSKFYTDINNYEKALKHRDLFDSLYLIHDKSLHSKEINELVTVQNIEIEKLKVDKLEGKLNISRLIILAILLALAVIAILFYNSIKNRRIQEQGLQFKENTLRMICHDLISPLLILNNYSKRMKKELDQNSNNNLVERIDVISSNIEKLHDLTNHTIKYLWTDSMKSKKKPLSFIFEHSVDYLSINFHDRNIQVKINCNEEMLDKELSHPNEIATILRNSLSNILKHSNATSIDINTITQDKKLKINILDNGYPITQNQREKILNYLNSEKKHQSETNIEGRLGLKIMRNEIKKIDAKVFFTEKNNGNSFNLEIPI